MTLLQSIRQKQIELHHVETVVKQIGDVFPENRWKRKLKTVNGPALKALHREMHGSLGNHEWEAPRIHVICDVDARPGYESMKAHEYRDCPDVLLSKVKLLASLLRQSQATCAYTGAGISTSSGIDDYATQDLSHLERKKIFSPMDAMPTLAHRVMAQMHTSKHLHYWIQQNHDGLPQKVPLQSHSSPTLDPLQSHSSPTLY
jgi:hypothetical protein